jgi:hypothetical protein
MSRSELELDLTAGGGAAPKPRVGSPAFDKLGSVVIGGTPGVASDADAVVMVGNGHHQHATDPIWPLRLKSRQTRDRPSRQLRPARKRAHHLSDSRRNLCRLVDRFALSVFRARRGRPRASRSSRSYRPASFSSHSQARPRRRGTASGPPAWRCPGASPSTPGPAGSQSRRPRSPHPGRPACRARVPRSPSP